jgi:hypothetical protein
MMFWITGSAGSGVSQFVDREVIRSGFWDFLVRCEEELYKEGDILDWY